MILNKLKNLIKSEIKYITLKDTILLFRLKENLRKPKITPVMKTLTFIGNAGMVWAVPALFMLKNRKTRFNGLLILYDIGENVIFNNLVTKFFFHRERPCSVYPEEYLFGAFPIGYSFPSGHSLTSFSAATLYILINPLNIFWALPLATMISLSRAYLFTHYPTDIICGSILGIINALLVDKLGDILRENKKLNRFKKVLDHDAFFTPKYYFDHRNTLFRTVKTDLLDLIK